MLQKTSTYLTSKLSFTPFFNISLGLQPAEPVDLNSNIIVYTSALAIYHTPSDACRTHGMSRECIHVTPRWGKFQVPHYDTAFTVTNPNIPSMGGLGIARVKLFFSSHVLSYTGSQRLARSQTLILGCGGLGLTSMLMEILCTWLSTLIR